MSSDRLELSDAEADDPAVTQSKPTKSGSVPKRKTLAMKTGMTQGKPGQSDQDRHESPEENSSAGTDTQTEQLTPWIVSYQWCIIVVALLYVVLSSVMFWYIISKEEQLNLPGNVLAPLSSRCVLYTDFENTQKAIENLKNTLDQKSSRKTSEWDNLVQKMEKLEALERSIQDWKEKNAAVLDEIKKDLRTVGNATVANYSTIQEKVTEMQRTAERLQREMQQVKYDFDNFNRKYRENNEKTQKSIQKQKDEFNDRLTEMEEKNKETILAMKDILEHDLGKKYDELDPLLQEIRGKVYDVLIPNAFNKEYVVAAFFLLMVVGLIFLCHQMRKNPTQQEQPITQRMNNMVENPVLRQIVPRGPPENAICVVSFNEHTQAHHKELVEQVLHGLPPRLIQMCPQSYHIIRQSDHVLQLPAVKLFLLFVDFSERNVIIEQPFIGQGDLKRTTVQAVGKLTGDYMIIYVKDPGSKRLEDNSRYNRNITIVQTQPMLKELNQRGRFFSVYDKLSEFQRANIQAIITDTYVA